MKYGLFLCCQSLFFLSVLIGLATVAQCADKVNGSFFVSIYNYISAEQWFLVLVPFFVGLMFCIGDFVSKSKKNKR